MADKLSIKDYLETATEASKRVRFNMIVLVVVTVLVLAGFLNSWEAHSWSFNRIDALENEKSEYSKIFFDHCNKDVKCLENMKLLHDELIKSLVENNYSIKVPFFGVSFDINDLGLLGGLSLVIVLAMLRLALRSYIISMRIGFKAAFKEGQEQDFYDIIASRQLFVFPHLEDKNQEDLFEGTTEKLWQDSSIRRSFIKTIAILGDIKNDIKKNILFKGIEIGINFNNKFNLLISFMGFIGFVLLMFTAFYFGALTVFAIATMFIMLLLFVVAIFKYIKTYRHFDILTITSESYWSSNPQSYLKRIPKLICLIPPFIYFLVIANDVHSRKYGMAIDWTRTYSGFFFSFLFLFIITGLSFWCISKWFEIDSLWEEYKNKVKEKAG